MLRQRKTSLASDTGAVSRRVVAPKKRPSLEQYSRHTWLVFSPALNTRAALKDVEFARTIRRELVMDDGKWQQDEKTNDRLRFEVELEFLQCLASPEYLHFLAQNQYLDDPVFLRYLSYLLYWTNPTYAKFVVFPHALHFLRLLQHAKFREALKSPQYALILHQQQGYHWQFSATSAFRPRKPGDALPDVPALTDEQLSVGPSPGALDLSPSPELQTPSQTPGHSQTPAQSMAPGRSRSHTTSPAGTYS